MPYSPQHPISHDAFQPVIKAMMDLSRRNFLRLSGAGAVTALVGGASLKADSFAAIANFAA